MIVSRETSKPSKNVSRKTSNTPRPWPRPTIHVYHNPVADDEEEVDPENSSICLYTTNVIDGAGSRFTTVWRHLEYHRTLARGHTTKRSEDGRRVFRSESEMNEQWREGGSTDEFDGIAIDEFFDPARLGSENPGKQVRRWLRCVERYVGDFPDKVLVPWVDIGGTGGPAPGPYMPPYLIEFFDNLRQHCPYIICQFYRVLIDFPDFDDNGEGTKMFCRYFRDFIDVWQTNVPEAMANLVIGLNIKSVETDADVRRRELKFIGAQIQDAWCERRLWNSFPEGSPAGIALFRGKPCGRSKYDFRAINDELRHYLT